MNYKSLQLNWPQLRSEIIGANITADVWGRGTGKSTGIGKHSEKIMKVLPRSTSVFLGATFTQLLTVTLSEVIGTWEKLGYIEDVHFVVRKKPPTKWRWPKPLHAPLSYDNFICWSNGTGFALASQDSGASSIRGTNAHGLYADEAALLDKTKLDEQIKPALRGDVEYYRNHPLLHFEKYASSKPIGTRGQWLLDLGKYYEEDGNNFDRYNKQLIELKLQFINSAHAEERRSIYNTIVEIKKNINYYPKKIQVAPGQHIWMYYHEADGFDNIKALGWSWFAKQAKMTSPIKFRVEVLNETLRNSEAGFYPNFKEEAHCYYENTDNYAHISSIGLDHRNKKERDCLWDADIDLDAPLSFAADWGASINCLIVYQRAGNQINVLNTFYVKKPEILDAVFEKASAYYRHHRCKHINFRYDRTGNNAKDNSTLTSAQQAAKILITNGFSVSLLTKGRAPNHELKYLLANQVLLEKDKQKPVVRINAYRCKPLITSILLASVIQGPNGERKDKRAEADTNFPQEDATHFSDAFDILIEGECSLTQDHWVPGTRVM